MYGLEYATENLLSMGKNSYLILDRELDTFKLDGEFLQTDYMQCADISWVAQVAPFIEEFSEEGQLVFDPFAGLGTTLLAAGMMGRESVGLELDKSRFDLLNRRIERHKEDLRCIPQTVHGDALLANYPDNVDLLVTNFPYYHASEKGSDGNLYNISDYKDYLATIENVVRKCEKSLAEGGYMIAFCENIRMANGNMLPQAYDICKILQQYFHLKEERIVLYNKPYNSADDITWTNRAHEYVYIMKKKTDAPDYDLYYNILNQIGSTADYVTIGTFGIYNSPRKGILDNLPKDVDIVIENKPESIIAVIDTLKKNGFTLYSWQDVVDESFDYQQLIGRYYMRAVRDDIDGILQFDINYESDYADFSQFYKNSSVSNNIRVASIADILALMDRRNSKQDKVLKYRSRQLDL